MLALNRMMRRSKMAVSAEALIADQDSSERIYHRAFEADHRIDPFTYS